MEPENTGPLEEEILSFSKPPFLDSMLIFGGVYFNVLLEHRWGNEKRPGCLGDLLGIILYYTQLYRDYNELL